MEEIRVGISLPRTSGEHKREWWVSEAGKLVVEETTGEITVDAEVDNIDERGDNVAGTIMDVGMSASADVDAGAFTCTCTCVEVTGSGDASADAGASAGADVDGRLGVTSVVEAGAESGGGVKVCTESGGGVKVCTESGDEVCAGSSVGFGKDVLDVDVDVDITGNGARFKAPRVLTITTRIANHTTHC